MSETACVDMYHGTDEAGYRGIMDSGFKPGTYFTPYLDTAISMGGAYVLVISIPESDVRDRWQVFTGERIPTERILYVQRFSLELLHLNRDAIIDQTRKRLASEGKVMCEDCEGRGEYRSDENAFRCFREPGGSSFKTRESVKTCKTCKGRGRIKLTDGSKP